MKQTAQEKYFVIIMATLAIIIGSLSIPVQASIVDDPVALSAKLAEMQFQREQKAERREEYWRQYRELPETKVIRKRCGKVYTEKGVRNNCKYVMEATKDASSIRHLW